MWYKGNIGRCWDDLEGMQWSILSKDAAVWTIQAYYDQDIVITRYRSYSVTLQFEWQFFNCRWSIHMKWVRWIVTSNDRLKSRAHIDDTIANHFKMWYHLFTFHRSVKEIAAHHSTVYAGMFLICSDKILALNTCIIIFKQALTKFDYDWLRRSRRLQSIDASNTTHHLVSGKVVSLCYCM